MRSRRARSSPSSTSTSSARRRPSAPWPSRCATASAASGSPQDMAEEVTPKNILMIGPTGVGKTEIARRLARLAQSPFIKVEASKFTEVGYVGRDVESMVRDLVELAVDMVRAEKADEVKEKARAAAEERLLDLLLPPIAADRAGGGPRRRARAGEPHARAHARAAPRRPPRRSRRRARRARERDAVVRDHRGHVGRGDRRQPEGHDGQHVPGADEEPAPEGARGARASRRPRSRPSWWTWSR